MKLFRAFMRVDLGDLRPELMALIELMLATNILFQDNPKEVEVWLLGLPVMHYYPGMSPDAELIITERCDPTLLFLEDCLSRCMKTPHRYIDIYDDLATNNTQPEVSKAQIKNVSSPLLMTVLEQYDAKVKRGLLTKSALLGVTTYIRKVLVGLSARLTCLSVLLAISSKFEVAIDNFSAESGSDARALQKQLVILQLSLNHRPRVTQYVSPSSAEATRRYLAGLETVDISE